MTRPLRRVGAVPAARAADSVPVLERHAVLQGVRAVGIGLVLLCAALAPEALVPGRRPAVACTLLYAGVVLLAEVLTRAAARRTPRLVLPLFSGMLVLDGLWLAWVGHLTGGTASPLRYLVLLHLAAVALVASYRTGLKLALWHSLLLLLVDAAVRTGALTTTGPESGGDRPPQSLVVFVVVLWLVAISTAALSAVNERELRRQRLDLESLTRLAERLDSSAEPYEIARPLLDGAVETFGFSRGAVLAAQEGQPASLLAGFGHDEGVSRRVGRLDASPLLGRAKESREPVLVRGLDPAADAWLTTLLPDAQGLVAVPLSAEGRTVGVLVLEHGMRPLETRVVRNLEQAASYAGLALSKAWLVEQLRRLASTDGLTKIANRRTFESTLEREIARAGRSGEPLSLVMVDIDHFKRLNDEQGHQAGDEVLRNVAAALSCECRDFDTPARYGGEEFAVVLPGCGPDEAYLIAERLRRAVSSAPSIVPITASAGVASYPAHARDADGLVKSADDALYTSKHDGRDRTTCSDGAPPQGDVEELLRRAVARRIAEADSARAQPVAGG